MSEQDTRVRSAIHRYAESMPVMRPSVDYLLASRRPPPPERVSPVRTVVAVGLTLALLVGALYLVRKAPQGMRSPDSPVVEVARSGGAVVWPLTEGVVASSRLTTAVDAAEAYVRVALELGSDWRRDAGDAGSGTGHVVEERYVQEQDGAVRGGLRVWLTKLEGLWFVTGSAGDGGPVITDARVVNSVVRVEAVPAAGDVAGSDRLALDVIGDHGGRVSRASARLRDGRWVVDIPVVDGSEAPVAVEAQLDGGDAGTQATAVVLPEEVNGHPAEDLFPAAIGGSYYAAWTDTLRRPADRRADWRHALRSYIEQVGAGILSVPAFDEVVVGREGHQVSGRFRTADGGAGSFELARLVESGPWFLVSLRDDAVDLRDAQVTATEVGLTIAVSGDPPRRYVEAFRPAAAADAAAADAAVASFALGLTTPDDGTVRRFYDAWAPPPE